MDKMNIMRVIDAAGAKIEELESENAEWRDANDHLYKVRVELEDKIEALTEKVDTMESAHAEYVERTGKELEEKTDTMLYWFNKHNELEAKLKNMIETMGGNA